MKTDYIFILIFFLAGLPIATFLLRTLIDYWIQEEEINKLPQEKKCTLGRSDLHDWQDSTETVDLKKNPTYLFARKQVCVCCGAQSRYGMKDSYFDPNITDSNNPLPISPVYFREMIGEAS